MKISLAAGSILSLIVLGAIVAQEDDRANTRANRLSARAIGTETVIIGDLGVPVGEVVTIKGTKKANGPIANQFWVEEVNGEKAKLVGIQVRGIALWPDGTVATLKGHEEGTLRFLQLKETNFGPNDPRWKGPYQRLFVGFEVTQVVQPDSLKIRKD